MLNSSALAEKLVGGLLDSSLGNLIVQVEAQDGGVLAGGGSAREREHDALRHVVKRSVRLEADRLPLIRAESPVAHVIDRCVTSGGSRRKLTKINDLGTTLLDARSELIRDPRGINEAGSRRASDGGVPDIGVHRGRVVTPDSHFLDVGHLGAGLEGELSEGTVVIKTGHGGERRGREIRSIVLADQSVSVGGVSDHNALDITSAVVVDSLADIDEDGAVVLEKITALHTGATRLGTDQEVVVNILESGGKIAGNHDLVEKGESAIMELSLDTTENLLLERKIQKVENDTLVLAKEFATINEKFG